MNLRKIAIAAALLVAASSATFVAPHALAADSMPEVRFKDGHFEPASLVVGAGQSFKVRVVNQGSAAIEFESFELNRERVVAPGQSVTVYMPSLSPGSYHFFDDFNHEAGEGTIVAR